MTQSEALRILKSGASIFLTGEPGSGKTHTVNQYVAWLRSCGIEPSITASTGIAATHIAGQTIHSWAGIGIRRTLSRYDLDEISQKKNVVDRVVHAKVLIIDEVSMLSADTLSMVDQVCKEVRLDDRPFGGLTLVLVGDFFQLPPVEARRDDDQQDIVFDEPVPRFAFQSPAWKALNPIICYLSEQHRQEDPEFLDFLTAIRRGTVGEKHIALLRTRYSPRRKGEAAELYSHNADVDRLNAAALGKLSGEEETYHMERHGKERLVETLVRGCLSPETLTLKVGARVMFTRNDIGAYRYANGTLGEVIGFADTGYPIVKKNDGSTVIAEPAEWRIEEGGKSLARIVQVPLRLAWAMTVHKSQGMSLDAAHMDLSQSFEYGQGYVALSRVRTLAGLTLAGLNQQALRVHPEILKKDAEFREASDVAEDMFAKLSEKELRELESNFIRASGGHPPEEVIDTVSTRYDKMRKTHANAYRRWTKEEDREVSRRFTEGETQSSIGKALGRKPGAIRARLIKLGLIEETE